MAAIRFTGDCSDPHDDDWAIEWDGRPYCASSDHAIVCCAKLKSGEPCTWTGRYRRDVGQGIAWFCGIHQEPSICACDRIIHSANPDEKECFTCWKSRTGWVTEMERREMEFTKLARDRRVTKCDMCGEYHVCAANDLSSAESTDERWRLRGCGLPPRPSRWVLR
jgi:hypothetical protein